MGSWSRWSIHFMGLIHVLSQFNLMISIQIIISFSTFVMFRFGQSKLYSNRGKFIYICAMWLAIISFSTLVMFRCGQSKLYSNKDGINIEVSLNYDQRQLEIQVCWLTQQRVDSKLNLKHIKPPSIKLEIARRMSLGKQELREFLLPNLQKCTRQWSACKRVRSLVSGLSEMGSKQNTK